MKAKWMGVPLAAVIAGAAIGGFVGKPVAEEHLAPLITEQLNTALIGKATYEKLNIGWNGTVTLTQIAIADEKGESVLAGKKVEVRLSPTGAIKYLLGEGSGLSLISKISVDKAEVYLRERQDTSWNVNHLVKPSDSDEPMSFRGAVELDDSQVTVIRANGDTYTLQDVEGVASFTRYPEIKGALSASFEGEEISVSGIYHNDASADFEMYVQANKLDLMHFKGLIPAELPISLKSGQADDIKLTIRRKYHGYAVDGGLEINNLAAHYDEYNITQGHVLVRGDGENLRLVNASAKVNEQLLTMAGTIGLEGEKPELRLHGEGENLHLKALVPQEQQNQIDGVAAVKVDILGAANDPEVWLDFNGQDLIYEGYSLPRLEAVLNYAKDIVKIEKASVQTMQGSMVVNGWVNLSNKAYEIVGVAQDLEIAPFLQNTSYTARGRISGEIYAKGKDTILENLQAHVQGQQLQYKGLTIDSLNTAISGQQNVFDIPYFNAQSGEGRLTAYGRVSEEDLGLRVDGHDLPLENLSGIAGKDLAGKLNVSGTLAGSISAPHFEGEISGDGGRVEGMHFGALYTDISATPEMVTVRKGTLQIGKGHLQVGGQIGLREPNTSDLYVRLTTVRAEELLSPWTKAPITGWLEGEAHLTGSLSAPSARGQIHLYEGSAYGKLLSDVKTRFIYDKGDLYIPGITIEGYGATLFGQGRMKNDNLDFTFAGEDLQLDGLLAPYDVQASGNISLQGTVTGALSKPLVTAEVASSQLALNGAVLHNLYGAVQASPDYVYLEEFSFDEGKEGKFHVQGGVRFNDGNRLFGKVNVEKGSVRQILRAAKLNMPQVSGLLTGQVDLDGTLEDPSLVIQGKIEDTAVEQNILGTAGIYVELTHHKLNIHRLELPVGNGLVAAEGEADLNGEARIQISSRDVPIQYLTPLFGEKSPEINGNLNFIANIEGQTKNPRVELSVSLDQASYQGVHLDHVYLLANMENQVISINQLLGTKGAYRVKIHGTAPLKALYAGANEKLATNEALQITADFNDADLGVLPFLTPWIEAGEGDLVGSLLIGGTYSQPTVNGEIKVANGRIRFKDVKKPLDHVNGYLRFTGTQGELAVDGKMGQGTAKAGGKVAWQGQALTGYKGTLVMDKMEVDSPYYKGPLTMNLAIEPVSELPKISGNILVEKSTVDIPLTLETGESNSNLLMDVTLQFGEKVRLYKNILYDMYLTGDVHFKGSLQHPAPEGNVQVTKGTLKYLNTKFRLDEGRADFVRGSFLPIMSLHGIATMQNYTIDMELKGPADKMQIKLTSDPELSEQQIVELLTFKTTGHINSDFDGQNTNTLLTTSLQMLAFGTVENVLQDTLHLDYVNFSTGSLDRNAPLTRETSGYYNIEIGKYLLPNMMFTIAKGINYDGLQYGIQYDVSRAFSLNGIYDTEKGATVIGKWRSSF